ncbi:MAG: hypothetical protein IJ125_10030 [Atopobiaceae bacterium]|nr:hypothetical protein [Atopobiaceae bacterium]
MAKKTDEIAARNAQRLSFPHKGRVTRLHVQRLIRDALERDGMVFIKAQSRMGKTACAESEANEYKRRGVKVSLLQFSGYKASEVPRELTAIRKVLKAQTLAHPKKRHLLLIEDIPAGDEAEINKIAYGLKKLLSDRVMIIVTMDIRATPLTEEFEDVFVVQTADLAVQAKEVQDWHDGNTESPASIIKITHGIPALVESLRPLRHTSELDDVYMQESFEQELSLEALNELNQSCMQEERLLRRAMMLLGYGSFADLEAMGLRLDRILMEELARDALLFGIETDRERFCCVAPQSKAYLAAFEHIASCDAPLMHRAVDILQEHRDFARIGRIVRFYLHSAQKHAIVLSQPLEFIEAGESSLVRNALKAANDSIELMESHPSGISQAQICMALLDGSNERLRTALSHVPVSVPAELNQDEKATWHQTGLVCRCGLLRKELPRQWSQDTIPQFAHRWGDLKTEEDNELSTRLATHARVRALILDGHVSEAYRQLIGFGSSIEPTSLTTALLCDDLHLVRYLVGDPETALDRSNYQKVEKLLATTGRADFTTYHHAAWEAVRIFGGETEAFPTLDKALACARRREDHLSRAWLLTAASLADLKAGVIKRAYVRAQQATILASQLGSSQLEALTHLCEQMARLKAGDARETFHAEIAHSLAARSISSLELVVGLFDAALAQDELAIDKLSRLACDMDCSVEAARLLDAIGELTPEVFDLMRGVLPEAWVAQSHTVQRRRKMLERERMPTQRQTTDQRVLEKTNSNEGPLLEISLLGGLSICLDGQAIPDAAWGRKKAAHILAMLAVMRGHSCERYELIEDLWPDGDFEMGRKSLYSTLSCLRKVLGDSAIQGQYLVTSNGNLQLNQENVLCDIDEFEKTARETLMNKEDDETLLEHCRKVASLYRGDLYVPSQDLSGVFRMRQNVIKRLYADVMVLGSQAALRQGLPREALWFARDAQDGLTVREDVTSCLMKALYATKRSTEAEEVYSRYSKDVIEQTGLPPSASMRELYSQLKLENSHKKPKRRINKSAKNLLTTVMVEPSNDAVSTG